MTNLVIELIARLIAIIGTAVITAIESGNIGYGLVAAALVYSMLPTIKL